MAVSILKDTQLRLVFEDGVDVNGKQVYKNKNFNNVKTTATVDQLFAVAQALVPLQTKVLFTVERNDSSDLAAM